MPNVATLVGETAAGACRPPLTRASVSSGWRASRALSPTYAGESVVSCTPMSLKGAILVFDAGLCLELTG